MMAKAVCGILTDAAGNPIPRCGVLLFDTGFAFALMDACSTIASHAEMWTDLSLNSDASVDNTSEFHRSDRWLTDYSHLMNDEEPFKPRWSTADARRAAIGDSLFAMALDFIVYHEIGHVILGHNDWLHWVRKRNNRAVDQSLAVKIRSSARETSILRGMEIEADQFATYYLPPGPWGLQHDSKARFHGHPIGAFLRCFSSATGIVACFSAKSQAQKERREHPDIGLRFLAIQYLQIQKIIKSERMSESEAQAVHQICRDDFIRIARILGATDKLRVFHVGRGELASYTGPDGDLDVEKVVTRIKYMKDAIKGRARRAALATLRQTRFVESAFQKPWIDRLLDGFVEPRNENQEVTAPKSPEFLAQSLYNAHYATGSVGSLATVILELIAKVVRTHNNSNGVREAYARALCNALQADGVALECVNAALQSLRDLQRNYSKDAEVRQQLANALFAAYEKHVAFGQSCSALLDELHQLASSNVGTVEERIRLAATLANAVNDVAGDKIRIQQHLSRIEELCASHPEEAELGVRHARAITNAALACPVDVEWHNDLIGTMRELARAADGDEAIEDQYAKLLAIAMYVTVTTLGERGLDQAVNLAEEMRPLRAAVQRQRQLKENELFNAGFVSAMQVARTIETDDVAARILAASKYVFGELHTPV